MGDPLGEGLVARDIVDKECAGNDERVDLCSASHRTDRVRSVTPSAVNTFPPREETMVHV
jgi:hypothetical protein